MYVTETNIGGVSMSPEAARDEMMRVRNQGKASNAVDQLRTIASLCNAGEFDASTINQPIHERKINGDATDQAILRLSESLGPVSEINQLWKKTFQLAFNSKNKYMIRTHVLAQTEGLKFALPSEEAATFREQDT